MFTGLVQGMGEVRRLVRGASECRLEIVPLFPLENIIDGESIAVNGACLSVEEHHDSVFTAYASAETLARTTLGSLRTGAHVNLERALQLGSRLGGHIVSGHVDCIATVTQLARAGQSLRCTLTFPREFAPEVIPKGSVTLGEGRNWGNNKGSGLAYTGRIEFFPLGRFTGKGDAMEGDYEREQTPKILLAGAYSYNDRALRAQGSNGDLLRFDQARNLSSYFVDFIFKYRGFAFYTDFMGRTCTSSPLIKSGETVEQYILTGMGLNVQASYLFPSNWEIALRNSTIKPDKEVQPYTNYRCYNQSTLGVTKYLIDHRLKVQADLSYNYKDEFTASDYSRWQLRFQVELGF